MKSQLLVALGTLAAGATFGLVTPAHADPHHQHNGPRYQSSHSHSHKAPPPPRYERRPAGRPGQVWAPGHWRADGGNYAWRAGAWKRDRPGYRYVPDRWVQTRHGWTLQRGYWAR